MMFWAPEGERPHTTFWQAGFHQSSDPRLYYETYKALIEPMHTIRSTFGFDFRPSLYAGQEVDYVGLYDLHQRAADHCKSAYEQYAEDDDE